MMETLKLQQNLGASQNLHHGGEELHEDRKIQNGTETGEQQEIVVPIGSDHINFLTTVISDDESNGDLDQDFIDPMSMLENEMKEEEGEEEEVEPEEIPQPTKRKGSRRIYRCRHCSKTFSWLKSLTVHERTHTGEKPYQCNLCSRAFVRSDYLKYHIKSHSNEEIFKCEECNVVFSTSRTLQRHMKSEHYGAAPHNNTLTDAGDDENILSCIYCDETFDDEAKQQAHLKVHDGSMPYGCDLCTKSFIRPDYLEYHRKSHATQPEIEAEDDSDEEKVEIAQPNRNVQNSLLAQLLTRVEKTEDNRFQCPDCVKTFAHDATLKIHLRTHTGEKPFSCSICKERFIRSDYLKSHMKRHVDDDPENLMVQTWKNMEEEKQPVEPQMYTKTEEGKFQCNVCERIVAHLQTMKIHLRIHTNEKPYRCYVCTEAFIRSDYLKMHMKSHFKDGTLNNGLEMQTGAVTEQEEVDPNFTQMENGRWVCNICDKVMQHNASLTQHSLFHSGERPYHCDVCDKSFVRLDYLKEHYKSKRHRALQEQGVEAALQEKLEEVIMKNHDLRGEEEGDEEQEEEMPAEPPEPKRFKPNFPTRSTRLIVFPKTLSLAENVTFQRTDNGRYKCSFCEKSFITSTTLKVHLRLHTGEKPYKCRKCRKAFIRSDYLKTHEKLHKQNNQESFLNLFSLTSKENTSCENTDEDVDLIADVVDDEIFEEEEEEVFFPFDEVTSEDTPVKSEPLSEEESERETEVEDKRAKHCCHLCEKRFVWPKSLKIHVRTHTGERPYKCDECNKAFNRTDSLRSHRKTHFIEKNVSCNICDAKFVLSSSLAKHKKSVHNIDEGN